jgi:hypothetical protein
MAEMQHSGCHSKVALSGNSTKRYHCTLLCYLSTLQYPRAANTSDILAETPPQMLSACVDRYIQGDVFTLLLIFPPRIGDIALLQLLLQELIHGECHCLSGPAFAPVSLSPRGLTQELAHATRITLGVIPL